MSGEGGVSIEVFSIELVSLILSGFLYFVKDLVCQGSRSERPRDSRKFRDFSRFPSGLHRTRTSVMSLPQFLGELFNENQGERRRPPFYSLPFFLIFTSVEIPLINERKSPLALMILHLT